MAVEIRNKCVSKAFEEQLEQIIPLENYSCVKRILEKLELLIQNDWDSETAERAILLALNHGILTKKFPEILCNTIDLALDYGLSQFEFNKVLDDHQHFHRLDQHLFNDITNKNVSEIKTLNALVCEITKSDPQFNENEILKNFRHIGSNYFSMCYVGEKYISSLAKEIKMNPSSYSDSVKIACVWKAMEMTSKHRIREIQVLSVMMMYESKSGRLAQVNTGEGKTIIIAMLAALLSLDGHWVDIVTTSPELAVPQSQQLENFYKLLDLTSSNIDKGVKTVAYNYNVLYGSVNEFEGDVLQDEFLKQGTRASRPFIIVIVDEADSMLVDGINNTTRLSSPMPGMNTLLPILIEIWDLFDKAEKRAAGGKMDVFGEVACAIENLLDGGCDKIEKEIRDLIENGIMRVPKHLKDFVLDHQLKIWVKSAFTARYQLSLNREYVIEDNEVKIVDLHNSGIVFKNMKWNDGIHQFLQIKNNVQLTCEDLVTNFLGNPTFFLKYKKIFGLTGTLGCDKTRHFLEKSYNTDSIIIPPFKAKLHTSLSPIVAETKDEWYKAIVGSCLTQMKYGRAVLIIADSIAETNKIKEKFLNSRIKPQKILMYQTEKDSEICENLIMPEQVVITTNICGHGVNIFPSSDARGGLHICLIFLPENSRVEEQNIGRTSRSGNPGTSQMILLGNGKLDEIKHHRDESNAEKLALMGRDMERTRLKAEIFNKFCAILKYLEEWVLVSSQKSVSSPEWYPHRNRCSQLQPEQFCGALKEKFSIWLKINESRYEDNPNELLKNYLDFEKLIINDLSTNTRMTENLFFFILSGVKCLGKAKYDNAIEQCTEAISIDENNYYSAFAYLNRAVALVAQNEHSKALVDLERACNGIAFMVQEMYGLSKMGANHSEELQKKFDRQIRFLDSTRTSIEMAIDSEKMQQKKDVDLVFDKWLSKLPANEIKKFKADAIELVMRGWMGSVKVVGRKNWFVEKWSDFLGSESGQVNSNGQSGSRSKRSRSRSGSWKC